jgi:hypothetical protein
MYLRTIRPLASADRPSNTQRVLFAAMATSLAVGLLALAAASRPARAEELVEYGTAENVDGSDRRGMSASNPRVRSLLAAHSSQLAVICVAGCDGNPKIVQLLPRPVTTRTGEFVPTAGTMDSAAKGTAPRKSSLTQTNDSNAVVCMAGCVGRPGEVVQRVVDLPPGKVAPKVPPAPKLSEPPPIDKPNEPLDIVR